MGVLEKGVLVICWLATLLGCVVGAYLLSLAIDTGSAPAQGAAAAVACGMAIIPYVFTRALEGMFTPRQPKQ